MSMSGVTSITDVIRFLEDNYNGDLTTIMHEAPALAGILNSVIKKDSSGSLMKNAEGRYDLVTDSNLLGPAFTDFWST